MTLSFVVSLLALAFLIWAIAKGHLKFTQADAASIFEGGQAEGPDDPVAYGTGLTVGETARDAGGKPIDTSTARRLLVVMFSTAVIWLLIGSVFGLMASLKMHMPDWLTGSAPLTFGRMRAMHLNSVIYGFLSVGGIGTAMWLIPTIFKTHLRLPGVAMAGAVLWNIGVGVGVWAIGTGWTDGMEWLEIPWQVDILLAVAGACFAATLIASAAKRREHHIYVSGWYLMAGLFWFPTLFFIANIPGLHVGAQQATVNWWFAHNVLGLWLTPLGLAAAYYFIPKIIGKPIYSYRLSLLGFWGLALFYSQVGIHHLIGGPVPTWVVTLSVVQSVMMVIPVIAVAINQHVLVARNTWAFKESLPLRFVSFGAIMYTLASLQGAMEALRSVNSVTHFTHYTVGHAHLGAYAFVALVLFGAMYFMLPRLLGRRWPWPGLVSLHFWLVALGFGVYFVSLTVGGVLQGYAMLDPARDFLASMELTVPYLQGRSLGGAMMTAGHIVFAAHMLALLVGVGETRKTAARAQAAQATGGE